MPSKSSICVFQCFPKLSWICWANWKWHYPYHGDHSNQNEHHQWPHDPYTHDKGSNHCSCHRRCLWVAGVWQEDTWDHVGENHTGDDHAQPKPVCQSPTWCGYYCWYYPPCCCPHFRSPRYSHCWRSWLRNTRNERHKRVESWSPKCWLCMSAVHMLISVITDEKSPPNEPYDQFFRELVPKLQFDFFTVGCNNHLCWNGLNGPSTKNTPYDMIFYPQVKLLWIGVRQRTPTMMFLAFQPQLITGIIIFMFNPNKALWTEKWIKITIDSRCLNPPKWAI